MALAAFPMDGDGPRLDEALSFEIVTGRDGRKQAAGLKRLQAQRVNTALREAAGVGQLRLRKSQKRRRMGMAAGAVVALLLVVGGARLWHPAASSGEVQVGMRR